MTSLFKIEALFRTHSDRDSDTDGNVYVGICGREFRCDSSDDDFERGKARSYIFGQSANVKKPEANDPRKPQLQLEDADRFPAYIRFDQASSDHWFMRYAMVRLNDDVHWHFNSIVEELWMGVDAGAVCFLRKQVDSHEHLAAADKARLL